MTGTIARRCGGRSFATWIAVNAAVADAPHPDVAVAPRLGGEPLDRVVPVERLVLGVLVERDAAGRRRCRGRRPGTARSRARAKLLAARHVRVRGASCPCRTGSSRGSPGTARPGVAGTGQRAPEVGRQLDAVAGRDPDVPVGRDLVARLARRAVGGLGRSGRRPSDGQPRAGADRRRATMARDGPHRAIATIGPWTRRARRVAYENPWITVWHDEVDPAGRQPGHLRRRPFREPRRRRGRPRRRRPGRCSSASTATRWTRYSWEIPEGGVPAGEDAARRGSARAPRGDRRRGQRRGASSARVHLSNSVTDELGVLFLATGPDPRRRPRPSRPRSSRSAGCPFDEALAMTLDGRITDADARSSGSSGWRC